KLENVRANQTLTLRYSEAKNAPATATVSVPFRLDESVLTRPFIHQENVFDDFLRDRLLHRRQSRQGPAVAVADLNGDGADDVYFSGRPGELYLSRPDGRLHPTGRHFSVETADELATVFFDADGDGDLDAYSVRGGNEAQSPPPDALFVNDGKGDFSLAQEFAKQSSGLCASAADFDGDGDTDVFVPGRLVPGRMPVPPRHRLLVNEGGKFSDQTSKFAPELNSIGQICAAIWSDADNDGDLDLLMAGEWTPLMLFENKGGKLERARVPGFRDTEGWWNSVVAADFDADGDMDYFFGNVGLNHRFRATPQTPVRVRVGDYDQNGYLDPILFYPMDGRSVPVPGRDLLCKHLPLLFKKFYTYHLYGLATEETVMEGLKSDTTWTAEMKEPRTLWVENRGKKGEEWDFVLHPAPQPAQWGPVYGLLPLDYDFDGDLDVIMTGGDAGVFHDLGRWDAMNGLILDNDGKGNFKAAYPAQTGFWVREEGRGLAALR
ncbi:MAG: VCBS repeat-containing protein, partial [Bacteroidia bacterium]|nr:VCBS repeat-containing protein [Bacteroidia bacterium]